MNLGILILHYNTPKMTDNLCQMIESASIVIDNGSDYEKRYRGKNECIRFEKNWGFTVGWNMAIKKLFNRFDAFWLMNSDIELSQRSIDRIRQLLNNYPEIGMITPSYNCWIAYCRNHGTGNIREVKCLELTAPVIRKSVFEKIGFFDDRFSKGYGVEFDFAIRMHNNGLKIFVDDGSSFIHKQYKTISICEGVTEYSRLAIGELEKGMCDKYGPSWRDLIKSKFELDFELRIKTAVYTTIFGNYTPLRGIPVQSKHADYYCITDNSKLKSDGWNIITTSVPRGDLHPRLRAKFFKIFPWECSSLLNYEVFIYIDGSIEITSPDFVKYCIDHLKNDITLFRHPERNCIYDEVIASERLTKYINENLSEQEKFYRSFHPQNNGLYACGILVRKNTESIRTLMAAWWWEIIKFTWQDQISFPVVCRLLNTKPDVFPDRQYPNPYFRIHWHDDQSPQLDKNLHISVLMPVYKTPLDWCQLAVKSILNQTYQDFEFIIVDDHNEKSELTEYLYSLTDYNCSLKVIRKNKNEGLASALNFGLKQCSGNLIVRMDSDDIARPNLLQSHYEYFSAYPDKIICGVQIRAFNDNEEWFSDHPEIVTRDLARNIPGHWYLNHPGVAYRKDPIISVGGYGDTHAMFSEDYALWCKLLKSGITIYNRKDVLVDYRLHDQSFGRRQQNRKSNDWKLFLEEQKLLL